ncbi:UNVERIFIED_CONTAM: hypothetical protein FKN15_017157 [Acipenser sinensis]
MSYGVTVNLPRNSGIFEDGYTSFDNRKSAFSVSLRRTPCTCIRILAPESLHRSNGRITVLLSLTVFMLLVAEIMPATSDSVPLIGVDPLQFWDSLAARWSRKEIDEVRVEAREGFSALQDPLEGLLVVLECCPEVMKSKGGSLGHCVLFEFQLWLKERPHLHLQQREPGARLRRLQVQALSLLTEKQPSFLEPLIDIYQLGSLERSVLLGHVGYLLHRGSYREAVLMSIKLKLQPDLDMEKGPRSERVPECTDHVCIPLVLQDKLQLAEAFVSDYQDLQNRLVRLLDSWCSPGFDPSHLLSRYPGIPQFHQKSDRLAPKVLSKQVFRLMQLYGVDPDSEGGESCYPDLRAALSDVRRLTSLSPCLPVPQLKSQVGEGRCLAVDCSEKARDQALRVLKHFNITITPADIFSRCQVFGGARRGVGSGSCGGVLEAVRTHPWIPGHTVESQPSTDCSALSPL